MRLLGIALAATTFGGLTLATGCKPNLSGYEYDGSEVLGIETGGLSAVPEIRDTPTAGQAAKQMGYYPSSGFGLTQSSQTTAQSLKPGQRICISAAYGIGKETAVKCGKVAVCKNMKGFHGQLPWKDGELCMQADCLSKTGNGLDAPGEVFSSTQPCSMSEGRPTAFSLTEYLAYAQRFGLGANVQTQAGYGLAGNTATPSLFYGDKFYQKTQGKRGNASVSLGGENLYSGKVLTVTYSDDGGMGLQSGAAKSEATVAFTEQGALRFVEFSEGGATVGQAEGTPTSYGLVASKGPSSKELGIVKTRRGNTFSLQGQGYLGPAGTVKMYLESGN